MNKSNTELLRAIVDKYQRQLILTMDAFVGGTIGGLLNAMGAMHIFSVTDWVKLMEMALWAGAVSAGAYLRQRGEKTQRDSSNGTLPPPASP